MALKDFFKKLRKKSQKSAQQAYSKKKAAEAKTPKRAASSNYDRVRQKAQPKITKPSGSSGGSSYRPSTSSWGSRPSGTTTQSRSTSQKAQNKPKTQRRRVQTGWQGYAQNTFKSANTASQSKTKSPTTIDWSKINKQGYKGTATGDLRKAYETGKGINALGSTAKTRTSTYGDPKKFKKVREQAEKEYKKKVNDSIKREIAFNLNNERMDLQQNYGYKVTDDEWKSAMRGTRKAIMDKKTKAEINKEAKKYGKQVAKEKVGASGKLKSKDLTMDDFLRTEVVSRNGNLKLDDELAYKVGSRTAYAANRNDMARFSHGVLQGLAPADVDVGPGKYNKAAKKSLQEAKESTAGMIGYGAGQMAGFALGGTSGLAKSLATGTAKAVAKNAGKSTAKKFVKNRAAEMAVETPLNLADAVKMARDEDGKVDKKKLAGYMALNTGLTAGAGAVMEGAAIKFTKKNADELIKLQAKANKGTITKEEGQKLTKLYDKLNIARKDTTAAKSNAAEEAYTKGRNMVSDARIERGKAKGNKRIEDARQARIDADNAIVERNREFIDANETVVRDATKDRVPDVTATPEGKRANSIANESVKKSTRETLSSKAEAPRAYSKEEAKDIDDTVDRISNMIAHGDAADARAEAEKLVRKHGQFDTEVKEHIPEASDIKRQYNAARNRLQKHSWVIPPGAGRTQREFLESMGTTPEALGRKLKLRSKPTKGAYSVDDMYDDLHAEWPEIFPLKHEDGADLSMEDRFQKLIDVALTKADDISEYQIRYLEDADLEPFIKELTDDVLAHAGRNADSMKPFTEKDAMARVRELSKERKNYLESADTIKNDKGLTVKEKIQLLDKLDEELKPIEDEIFELEEKYGKAVEKKKPVKKNMPKKEPKPETRRVSEPERIDNIMGRVVDDIKREETDRIDELSKRISERTTYNDTDKAVKKSAKNIMETAPEQANELDNLLTEYDTIGKKIAANKAKAKNSKTPKHIEQYEKENKRYFKEQREIADKIKKLEDTYASRYKDGKSVLSDIEPTDAKTIKKTKTNGFHNRIESIRRKWESSLIEFEKVAKKTGNQKLLNAVNNVMYARNKAGAWIETARSSFDSRTAQGKSLNQIFKDAGAFKDKKTRADFNTYALLRHHIDRVQADKPIFMKDGQALSIPDAKKAMIELESKYGKEKLETFSDELTAYSNDLLKYRLDAGLITKETYDNAMKYEHYVPSYRIREGEDGFIYEEPQGVTVEGALKGATGGDSEVEDLYSQLYKITNEVITNAEQNEMIKLYAEDMKLDLKEISKDATVEDFEKARIKAGKDGTISYYVDGHRITLKADPQAVNGLREWNNQDYALLTNACAKLGKYTGMRIFKGLITDWNIAFGIRNGPRDFQQALVNSKDTWWFAKSLPSAVHAVLPTSKNNAYRKLYEVNGGKYYSPSGDPMAVKDPTKSNIIDTVVKPLETFNGMIEMNPRMAEFIGTINKEANKILKNQNSSLKKLRQEAEEIVRKNPPKDASDIPGAIEDKYAEMVCKLVGKDTIDRAMRNAADITLNFSRHGAIGKALNSGVVPYFNPSIQGLSKTIRLFSEGRADKALLNICMKLGTMTIAPALFNEYMLRDNRDYQNLNTRDKDTNFFISIGDGKFIKIPKPRENAVLAEPMTYGLRYFFDKAQVGSIKPGEYSSPENWKQMFDTAKSNIGPVEPWASNYFSPIINTALNKTWYGGSIEDVSDQELPVNERKDEATSALAIMLGDSKALKQFQESNFAQSGAGKLIASNLSPKKIDNLLDSYTGVIYDMWIKPTAANRDLGSTPANIANYAAGQFILDGVYSNKLATEYYTKMDKLNKGAKEGKTTPQKEKFMVDYGYDVMNYSTARSTIFSDDKDFSKMTPKEKQLYARSLRKHQNNVYLGAINDEKNIFGTFDNNFKNDPYKVMARELKKTDFEKETGKMAEEKVINDLTFTDSKGNNAIRDAFDQYKESDQYKDGKKEKEVKRFFNDTIRIRGLLGAASASKSFITWTAAALVAAERNKKSGDTSHTDVAKAYGASEDTRTEGNNYIGFDFTLEEYAKSHGTLEKMARRDGKNLSEEDDNKKTIALAVKNYADGAYYIEGKFVDYKQNPARCIVSDGMSSKEYNKWMDKHGLRSYSKSSKDGKNLVKNETKNGSVYYKSSEEDVINAIEEDYGDRSNEFKAAMYRMFYDYGENPYGEVGDYSLDKDKGLHHDNDWSGGYGGRGRRRYGRRGYRRRGYGGYGGGYGGSPSMDWNTYVGNIFTSQPEKPKAQTKEKVHDYTKKSELTEAYRRRAQNKQTIKNKKA